MSPWCCEDPATLEPDAVVQAAAQRWIDGATTQAVSAQEKVRSALIKPAVAEIGIQ